MLQKTQIGYFRIYALFFSDRNPAFIPDHRADHVTATSRQATAVQARTRRIQAED